MARKRLNTNPAQLSLSFQHDKEFLVSIFEQTAGSAVRLVLTENSVSMLSVRKEGCLFIVRLQRMFLNADVATLREIALFIKHGKGTLTRFRSFVNDMCGAIIRKPPGSFCARTRGKYHDLHFIFQRLNMKYFDGKVVSVITWGSRSTRRSVRKRILGSYSHMTDVIRINPVLDKNTVPAYYIEFIVYHEMLHAAMGVLRKNGRRAVHTRDFKEREQLFMDYEKALQWEKWQRA